MARSLARPFRRRPAPARRCRTCRPRTPARSSRPARPGGSEPVTQPVSGRCPRSSGGSLNAVCRTDRGNRRPRLAHVPFLAAPGGLPGPARAGTASSSPAPCRATVHRRTGSTQARSQQGSGHLNDQALTSRNESMITATHPIIAAATQARRAGSRPRRSLRAAPPGSRPARSRHATCPRSTAPAACLRLPAAANPGLSRTADGSHPSAASTRSTKRGRG